MSYMGKQTPKRIQASALLKDKPGHLVNYTASYMNTPGNIKIYDALSAVGDPVHEIDFQAPTANAVTKNIPCHFDFDVGCYFELTNITEVSAVFR